MQTSPGYFVARHFPMVSSQRSADRMPAGMIATTDLERPSTHMRDGCSSNSKEEQSPSSRIERQQLTISKSWLWRSIMGCPHASWTGAKVFSPRYTSPLSERVLLDLPLSTRSRLLGREKRKAP